MKPVILHGLALLGLQQQIDAFHVATTRPRRGSGTGPSTLRSTRHLNEYGEPVSDLQSTLSSIDGAPDILYHNNNKTDIEVDDDDDDDEGTSVMSSVTHWSDIMRQDSWLQQQQQTHQKLENSSSLSPMHATAGANDQDVSMSSNGLWLNDLSALSKENLDQIEEYWDRLMPTVSYLGTSHVAQIYKALQVAYRAHRGQMRKSGEPFIIHVRWSVMLLFDMIVSS